jgi:Transposase IS200 like
MEVVCQGVCADFDVVLNEFNGERNRVHIFVEYPPKVRLSELVNGLKGVTSRKLREEFPTTRRFARDALWTLTYYLGKRWWGSGGGCAQIYRRAVQTSVIFSPQARVHIPTR